jgi:hypothetical protein
MANPTGGYLMYYCKWSLENGYNTDRIWRAESIDGRTWTNRQFVYDGSTNGGSPLDYQSCSPGIVIVGSTWHMYFIGMGETQTLYLHHATAPSPGIDWTWRGIVTAVGAQVECYSDPGCMETPSPLYDPVNDRITLYLLKSYAASGYWRRGLFKYTLLYDPYNPYNNANSIPTNVTGDLGDATHARVTYYQGVYYLVYSKSLRTAPGIGDPPKSIYIATSISSNNFPPGNRYILQKHQSFPNSPHTWDSLYMWSPHLIIKDGELWI